MGPKAQATPVGCISHSNSYSNLGHRIFMNKTGEYWPLLSRTGEQNYQEGNITCPLWDCTQNG